MVDKASGTNINVYQESVEQVAATLETDLQYGLKADQVQARRDQFGINKLPEKKREPAWKRLL